MKLNYFPDTDSLYIDLSHKQSTESQEVSEGVVLDYDAEGNLVGIDIDHASQKAELARACHEPHSAGSKSSELNRGGRRYLPYAFTEHGALQATYPWLRVAGRVLSRNA